MTERQLVRTPDGRDIEILVTGPDDGLPFVVHDGTPVGLGIFKPTAEAARVRGLRPIQIARPGYEGSTPRPGRRVADIAADTTAVLDHLGSETFVTAGWSGGGPHALACAALLPDRCLAAASVAGVAPYHAEGLDWTAGMGPENIEEFGATLRGPEALTEYLEREAEALGEVTGEDVASSLGGLVSAVDVAALTGEFAENLAEGLRGAVRNGVAGWRDDDLAFVADWGFSLSETENVAIWQGDQDRMVPFAHGEWLAAHTPGARVHLMRGEGHLTMTVSAIDRILDDLLDLANLAK